MLDLFIGLKRVIKRRIVHIDNSVFRLHWLFTSIMLISCSLIVTSRQYVGDPIDCMQTDDIPSSVLNTYCWIHSTYTVPSAFDKIVGIEVAHPGIERSKGRAYEDAIENALNQQTTTISSSVEEGKALSATTKKLQLVRNNRNLFRSTKYRKFYTYYQWVCFALFIQAILFYLPYFIWKLWEGGLLNAITVGMQLTMISNEEVAKKRKILNDYLYSHLRCHRGYAYKYFICEFLCFANVTAQFYLTDWFFDGEFFQYGIKVLRYARHDPSFSYDPSIFIFPRMTKCTFHSYGFSGDVQRHDALCMLTLNVVNEKIYLFIWFWLALLWFLLIFVLAYRIVILFAWNWRGYFLTKRCTLSHFEDLDYICRNGNIGDWFLLYMLGSNLDPLLMREVTDEMAARIRSDNEKEYDCEQKIMKHNVKLKRKQIDLKFKKRNANRDLPFSNCIDLRNLHHSVQSSAPPAQHLQFSNSQYLNCNYNLANKIMHCNQCSHHLTENSCMVAYKKNRDDETASLMDNEETIEANHCLKDERANYCREKCDDECTDLYSMKSVKSNKRISRNSESNESIAVRMQLNCIKSTKNCKSKNANNQINENNSNSNQPVQKLRCEKGCCLNSFFSDEDLNFGNKLNQQLELSNESEDEQTIRKQNRSQNYSKACSQIQTSGYQSNPTSNCSNRSNKSNKSNNSNISANNSDTLDQVSSLEQTSEKAYSSPERHSSLNETSERPHHVEKDQFCSIMNGTKTCKYSKNSTESNQAVFKIC